MMNMLEYINRNYHSHFNGLMTDHISKMELGKDKIISSNPWDH
jgi:hypothetical protein